MSAPSPTVDPIQNSAQWHKFFLLGVASPGSIPKGGVKGFKRKTGWDVKKGKGTAGATLTRSDIPPVKGTFTLQLTTPQDFTDWDAFVATVLSIDAATQGATGLAIYYPGLASIGLTTVVVEEYGPPVHQGKGMYHVEIELLEWAPPPATSAVSTVATTAPDAADGDTPPAVDPRITQAQAELRLRQQAAAKP